MNIQIFCVAALGFLTIILGFVVSIERGKTKTVIGCPTDPASSLYKAVRAHGNTTEYAPVLMVLIYALNQYPLTTWIMCSIIGATVCRYIIALGLLLPKTLAKPNPLRAIGAVGTYVFGLTLCVALAQLAFRA